MYAKLALQLSRAHTRKSQRLLERSRTALAAYKAAATRSESNLAKSYGVLAMPQQRLENVGRVFTRRATNRCR